MRSVRILPNSLRKTIFNLITTDTPINAESSYSVVFRLLTASVFFVSFFFNANVVGTNLKLHGHDDAIQISTHNICFIKKIKKKKKSHKHHQINPLMIYT